MIDNKSDSYFMKQALKEASLSLKENHVPVGALIVCDGKIIAKSRNSVYKMKSMLAHAEMNAISEVQNFLFDNKGKCTLYTTLEPCMMCLGAIVYNEFKRLVVGAKAPSVGGLIMLQSVKHYKDNSPEIVTGVLEEESRRLIKEYVHKTGLRADLLS